MCSNPRIYAPDLTDVANVQLGKFFNNFMLRNYTLVFHLFLGNIEDRDLLSSSLEFV